MVSSIFPDGKYKKGKTFTFGVSECYIDVPNSSNTYQMDYSSIWSDESNR